MERRNAIEILTLYTLNSVAQFSNSMHIYGMD